MRNPADLSIEFRRQGLKMTPQRELLFRLLHDNDTHPTAEALFATARSQMPSISLRTVYQTLNDLVAMGELHAVSVGGGSTRFDANNGTHHHARCDVCGDLRDVYVDGLAELRVDGLAQFEVSSAEIVFSGTCAACAARAATALP